MRPSRPSCRAICAGSACCRCCSSRKLFATSVSLGSGASGGIFSPSLFMGATLGGAFGAAGQRAPSAGRRRLAAFAIVGMAAMVGGGTGAAMTAVTMIFEMTRDYDIVLPMIIAVALSIGVRRLLSRENIYTIKLVARGHLMPKALHANMFLVRHAEEVMDRDVLLLPADTDFAAFLRQTPHSGFKHIVVTRDDRIAGVLRVNTELRRGLEGAYSGVLLGDFAQKNFTIARAEDVVFDVVDRMWRHGAALAIVTKGGARPPRRTRGRHDFEGAYRRLGRREHPPLCQPGRRTDLARAGPFTIDASAGRISNAPAAIEVGNADRQIEPGLPLQGNRLKGDGPLRSADQNIGAETCADRRLGRRTRIMAGKRAEAAIGRRINRPYHFAAGRRAQIEAEFADRPT